MATLQAGVKTFADVQAQPNYQQLSPDIQADIAMDFFEQRVASQPSFQQATREAQEAMRKDFRQQYQIPEVQPSNVQVNIQPVQRPQAQRSGLPVTSGAPGMFVPGSPGMSFYSPTSQQGLNQFNKGQLAGISKAIKGATLGYMDPFQPPTPLDKKAEMIAFIPEFAGSILPAEGIASLYGQGAKYAGKKLLPYTSSLAIDAGLSTPLARPLMTGLSHLQRQGLGGDVLRNALGFGTYGALKSHPNNQFDVAERLKDAVSEGAIGASFPLAGKALGKAGVTAGNVVDKSSKLLQGSAKFIQEMSSPTGLWHVDLTPRVEALAKRFADLFDHVGLTEKEAAQVTKTLSELQDALTRGKIPKDIPALEKRAKAFEARAKFRETAGKLRYTFARTKDGSTDFASISKNVASEAGIDPGPIRLVANTAKLGKRHIEEAKGRLKAIQSSGYEGIEDFVGDVANNFDEIWRQKDGSLLLMKTTGKYSGMPIHLEKALKGDYYTIRTAFRSKANYAGAPEEGRKLLWKGTPRPSNDIGSAERPYTSAKTGSEDTNALRVDQSNYSQDSTTQKASQPSPKLTGSIKEMAEQVEQAAGLPKDAGASTAGQVEKQTGQKLTQEQKDIHTNLRAVARTEVVDAEKGIHKQLPLTGQALKYGDVEVGISEGAKKTAQVVDDAMSQGKAIRVEYVAEEAGRSAEAAKITATGNIKAETTTFTPLYWGKTKEGKALVHGYNQRGFFTTYHLEPSSSGSQILKAKATEKAPFVGEYANVYLGQRPFLAKDVLNRGVRSETGLVKTSEAISILQDVTNNLDKVFKLADDPRLSESLRTSIRALRDADKWGRKEMMQFKRLIASKEFKTTVCSILGLKA